nr:putative reverse transcriptase domain-containing protein [Tanacetum cinerariifolium]
MSSIEYHTILKYRLMILLFLVDAICRVCRKACLDSFGEHAVDCKELPGFKYRHDMVGRSTLRPADVLVFRWVGGKHACVDLNGVSPLVRLSSKGFTVGQATLKAASCKVTKHEKACIENQHVFIPFALDTFAFLAPEAVELLSRVQRVMHNNVMTPRFTDDGGENPTVEPLKRRAKWDNDDYVCRGLILNELGSHLRIEESLRVQDSDKPKGNNVAGPSVFNVVEHNNSF